jgi:immunoglobulin-like protein involved in spore germination/sporulation and spore germination protein
MRFAAASALAALTLTITGCGGSDEEAADSPPAPPPPTTTQATTESTPQPVGGTDLGVYFVREDKLGYAARTVGLTPKVATAALEELLAGPTEAEHDAGLATDIPPGTKLSSLAIANETATAELSNPLDELATAQVVQTLLQFETVARVELAGRRYRPVDVEPSLPAILVESPVTGEKVSSPLRLTGTANTFEATFEVEVRPHVGKPLVADFVTATSGSGTRGTFDKTLDYTVDRERPGSVVVFENSAEDGSVINRVEIPVVLTP